jgi:hypothetical protein
VSVEVVTGELKGLGGTRGAALDLAYRLKGSECGRERSEEVAWQREREARNEQAVQQRYCDCDTNQLGALIYAPSKHSLTLLPYSDAKCVANRDIRVWHGATEKGPWMMDKSQTPRLDCR